MGSYLSYDGNSAKGTVAGHGKYGEILCGTVVNTKHFHCHFMAPEF